MTLFDMLQVLSINGSDTDFKTVRIEAIGTQKLNYDAAILCDVLNNFLVTDKTLADASADIAGQIQDIDDAEDQPMDVDELVDDFGRKIDNVDVQYGQKETHIYVA